MKAAQHRLKRVGCDPAIPREHADLSAQPAGRFQRLDQDKRQNPFARGQAQPLDLPQHMPDQAALRGGHAIRVEKRAMAVRFTRRHDLQCRVFGRDKGRAGQNGSRTNRHQADRQSNPGRHARRDARAGFKHAVLLQEQLARLPPGCKFAVADAAPKAVQGGKGMEAAIRPLAQGQNRDFGDALAQASILIVDDEAGMRHFLSRTLGNRCKAVEVAPDCTSAMTLMEERHFDLVIVDNRMQGKLGVDWLAEQRASGLFPPAILITAFADLETAIQALQAGAADFLLKPFRSNQILNAVARCLERVRLERENHVLRHELRANSDHILLRDRLIGSSPAIEAVRQTIARVAPLPSTVLLTGQSGTGKEVAARMIHTLSDRAAKPFVPVNCAAIPADMVETELFGHVKGAFTGAHQNREGLFLHARGGTLFLDEIGELPLAVQSKLLRVLEDRRVRPLGSEREVAVDVRLLFATNSDLTRAVAEGRFRADLLYRINVLGIHMPPLSQRGDDVKELAHLFMAKLALQMGMPPVPVTPDIEHGFTTYDWPGNVRELRNTIERALILGRFSAELSAPAPVDHPGETLADLERRAILAAMAAVNGDRDMAARRLGISRKTIDRRLADWNG